MCQKIIRLILGRYCRYQAAGWFRVDSLNCLSKLERVKANNKIKRAVNRFKVALGSCPQLFTRFSHKEFVLVVNLFYEKFIT
jgi:hypothetical protein